MTKNSGRMIVASPSRWDEACFAVPAVRALTAAGLETAVLCPAGQQEFWQAAGVPQVIAFPEKSKPKALAAQLGTGWDAALAWESGPAAEALLRAGIARRPGPAGMEKWRTHALTAAPGPLEHRVRFYLASVAELGCAVDRPGFFAPGDFPATPVPAAVLICPASDFGANHEWPLERWEEIARKLMEMGRTLTVAGIGSGRRRAETLAGRLGPDVRLSQATPLGSALPLLAAHPLVVAADGSLPHLAAFAGATCITLFGPNDPAWKRPLGTRHTVVRRHVECAPCLLPKCPLDLRCQHELGTARVLAALT